MPRPRRHLPPPLPEPGLPDQGLSRDVQTFDRQTPRLPAGRRWHRAGLLTALLVMVVLITGGWLFLRAISVIHTADRNDANTRVSLFQQLTHIVTASDDQIRGEAEDRINILLLGIGGPGHDGPYLTDTMIVASLKPSTKQVSMISIPRDLVVDIPGYDYRKINNVLSFGRDQEYPGGGEALTVKVVSDLFDLPIHYYARIDFNGFADIINQLGGIEVTVDTAFTDYQYPTLNYGYQTINFPAGQQKMDGEAALKFARSRHGNHGEGSDYARARRQQKIILAARQKALSLSTLINPKKISDLLGSLGSHSQTNMEVWEMMRLASLAKDVDTNTIINKVLDDGPNGLVHAATGLGGAFILVPNDQTNADIQFFAQNIFLIGQAEREQASLLVANASGKTGLADRVTTSLTNLGLTVAPPITIRTTTIDKTVVLDHSQGKNPGTISLLKSYGRAQGIISLIHWEVQTKDTLVRQEVEPTLATSTNAQANVSTKKTPTLVLILGKDQPTRSTGQVVPTTPRSTTTNTNKNTNAARSTNSNTNKNTNTSRSTKTNTNAALNTNSTSPSNTNTTVTNTPVLEATEGQAPTP